jgi:hypothetical protein
MDDSLKLEVDHGKERTEAHVLVFRRRAACG